MDRIIKAFTFKTDVYSEVESDTSFTTTAWLIVAVVSFLSALGSLTLDNFGSSLLAAVVGAIFAVIGFALAAFVINLVGRSVFKAEVTFEELVRTVGLAYVWQVVGFLGILGLISEGLRCIVAPAIFIGSILWLISAFIASKEALDLEWLQTIITVILGWVAFMVVLFVAGLVLAAIGLGGAALFGAFS
jgi:hypothetical protein